MARSQFANRRMSFCWTYKNASPLCIVITKLHRVKGLQPALENAKESHVDAKDSLRKALMQVPMPEAPPRLSRDGAAVGLAFLDGALRLNHVRRLTERITVVEHRAARRVTEVDISLRMLDEDQIQAARMFQTLRTHSLDMSGSISAEPAHIWVPVARVSRQSVAPIDVRDSTGARLPRLTQYETSRLLASALYRLLRGILSSLPAARQSTQLGRLLFKLHEPRWLIQSAILTMLMERGNPQLTYSRAATADTVPGPGQKYREIAVELLLEDSGGLQEVLKDYFDLLNVVLNEYLLVVALNPDIDEHLLRYDSPLLAPEVVTPAKQRYLRMLRTNARGYQIEYIGEIPSSLRAYHLVFEADPGVEISRMYLTTDADRRLVDELVTDLDTISHRLELEGNAPSGEATISDLLELEAQTVSLRLAELLRRRRWEASQAAIELPDARLPACADIAWAVISGEGRPTSVGVDDSLLKHPLVSASRFRMAAEELRQQDFDLDLSLENDPISHRAHAYWRRQAGRVVNTSQITIRSGLLLRDSLGTGPGLVRQYSIAVSVIAYVASCLLAKDFWPFTGQADAYSSFMNAEALIAVLLLVPGFLYTRLHLPQRHTVAGHLGRLPRLAAQMNIGIVAFLALSISVGAPPRIVQLMFAAGVVIPLVMAAILMLPFPLRRETLSTWVKRFRLGSAMKPSPSKEAHVDLASLGAPRWIGAIRRTFGVDKAPDARFVTTEARL